jgi:hypothetical protein
MTDIIGVLRALETTLRRVDKLAVGFDTGNINPPYALLSVPNISDYRKSFSGTKMILEPTIALLTSSALDEIGTLRLAEYAAPTGDKSIYSLFASDRRLGGVVEDCQVTDFRSIGMDEYGLIGYYGGIFGLRIMASG